MHSGDALISYDVATILITTVSIDVRADRLTKLPRNDVAAVLGSKVLAALHYLKHTYMHYTVDLMCI